LTEVNNPTVTPRQAGARFTYLRGIEGWLDLGDWLHTEIPAHRWSPIQVLTKYRTGSQTRDLLITRLMPYPLHTKNTLQ